MGSMEEEVRDLITEMFGSVPKLSEATGVPQQTIYSALRSGLVGASIATVIPSAEALRIDPFGLMHNRVVRLPSEPRAYTDVKLYGSIAAGKPVEPDATDETCPIPTAVARRHPEAFLLKVSGESMNRVLPNGCYALAEPCTNIEGQDQPYVVAVGAHEATVKRVHMLANGLVLEPDSTDPTFKSRTFDFSDADDEMVTVLGRVVWFCMPPDWSPDKAPRR